MTRTLSLATLPDELLLLILDLASPEDELSLRRFRQLSRHFNNTIRRRASTVFHLHGRRINPSAALHAGLFTGTCSVSSIRLRSTNVVAEDLISEILNVDTKVKSLTCLDLERTAVLAGKEIVSAITRSPSPSPSLCIPGVIGRAPFAALQTLTLAFFHDLQLPSADVLGSSLPSLDTLALTNSCIRTSSVTTFGRKLAHLPKLRRAFLGGAQFLNHNAEDHSSVPLFRPPESETDVVTVSNDQPLVIEATFMQSDVTETIVRVIGNRVTLASYLELPLPKGGGGTRAPQTATDTSIVQPGSEEEDEKEDKERKHAERKDEEVLLEQLKHWAAVSCRSPRSGITPLHSSCYNNNFRAVRWLVQNGASTLTKDNDGYTPLFMSVVHNCPASARVLLSESDSTDHEPMLLSRNRRLESVLYYACLRGNANMTRVLLKHLMALKQQHEQASESWTPLHAACIRGHVGIVKLLLRNEFTVDQVNKYKQTALHIAVRTRQADVVAVLLEAGSNVQSKDEQGQTCRDVLRRLAPSTEKGNEAVKRITKMLKEFASRPSVIADVQQGKHPDITPRHLHNKARRSGNKKRGDGESNRMSAKANQLKTSADNTPSAQRGANRNGGANQRKTAARGSRRRRRGGAASQRSGAGGAAASVGGGAAGCVNRGVSNGGGSSAM